MFNCCSEVFGGADGCGPELCPGMQLIAWGKVLRSNKIAFVGKPLPPAQDTACKTAPEGPLSRKDDFSNTGKTNNPAAAASATAAAASVSAGQASSSAPSTALYTGSGDVYMGNMWLQSKQKASPYDSGHFQLVYVRQLDSDTPVESTADGYFVAKPYTLTLELYQN